MTRKRNAPGPKAEGVVCQLAGDTDVYATEVVRLQRLLKAGISANLAQIISPLAFGEVGHA